jgi:aldose sugar dehydrogenase
MMKKLLLLLCISGFVSCKAQKKENDVAITPDTKQYTLETVVSGIDIPWGIAWLPDGSMLITERGGALYHFKNNKLTPLQNTPTVVARGQGGLMDVAVHPNYTENGWIYLTFSSPVGEGGSNTELVRAQLKGQQLVNIKSIYKATPNSTRSHHFGSRIVFDNEGYVYFTIGDRGDHDNNPQDLKRDGGKVYRLHDDGRIPKDNPFVGQAGVKEATYSYGHRNPQGMVVHPETGEVWTHEHGPRGGDEINIVKKAANYGWPVITYGINYSGTIITEETHREGMEQPLYYWVPSIAPSGMAFVTGDRYPEWKGHLLVGSLVFQYLELVKLQDNEVVAREKIADGIGRLRDVRMGPDGYIYLGVEGKGVLKIVPKS